MRSLTQRRRARPGFDRIIILTIPPAITIVTHGHEDERVLHNTLLLQNPGGTFDGVVDIDRGCLADPSSDCYSDGIHWIDKGTTLVAGLVAPTLRAIT